jgi:hypothetical protein
VVEVLVGYQDSVSLKARGFKPYAIAVVGVYRYGEAPGVD